LKRREGKGREKKRTEQNRTEQNRKVDHTNGEEWKFDEYGTLRIEN
jgi:hypothetical protein